MGSKWPSKTTRKKSTRCEAPLTEDQLKNSLILVPIEKGRL